MEEYESDPDHSDVESADFDSEKLVTGKPVITRPGRYGLMFRRSNGKPRHYGKLKNCYPCSMDVISDFQCAHLLLYSSKYRGVHVKMKI